MSNDPVKEETVVVDYKKKYEEAIHFIEMTDALTYDQATSRRIEDYLIREGIWKPLPKKDNSSSTE